MIEQEGRAYWERVAKHYDRSMWLLGAPVPPMLERIGEASLGARNVLEVAAGTGLVTRVLSRNAQSVVATDYAAAMVHALQQRVQRDGLSNVRCELADLYALPYKRGTFEVVVATNVLHLVPDLPSALSGLRALLQPRGRLVVPTYCHAETLGSRMLSRVMAATGFPSQRRLSLSTLRDAVEIAGLRVTRCELLKGLLPVGYVEAVHEGA